MAGGNYFRRLQMFNQSSECYWCGREMVFESTEREPLNLATVDHLRSRLHPLRRAGGGKVVLACWSCNQARGMIEVQLGFRHHHEKRQRIRVTRRESVRPRKTIQSFDEATHPLEILMAKGWRVTVA